MLSGSASQHANEWPRRVCASVTGQSGGVAAPRALPCTCAAAARWRQSQRARGAAARQTHEPRRRHRQRRRASLLNFELLDLEPSRQRRGRGAAV